MTADFKHIHYVTANFHGLQGLKLIPFWLYLWIDAALTFIGLQNAWALDHGFALRLGAIVVLGSLYGLITLFYRRRYGQVERLKATTGEKMFWVMTWMLVGAGLLAYLLTSAGRGTIENGRLATPFNVIILLLAWLLALRFTTHRQTSPDVLSALLGLGMGGLALLALILEVSALAPYRAVPGAIAYVLLGGATLLVGAWHHWLLTKAFGSIPEEEESHA